MKLFITGASGFVGGAVVKHFRAKGHEVLAMSRSEKSDEKINAIGGIPVRCKLGAVPSSALNGCDVVVHAAAYVEEWGTKAAFYEANVEGTKQLLLSAKEAGAKKFILIGTEAALWHGQDIIDADETYPYAAQTPFLYSETKREAEKLVLQMNEPGKFETVSVRPRMVWGPGDQTILPKAIDMYKAGKFKWVHNGQYQTSTSHINNVVEGVRLAIEKGKGGEAYFITDDELSTFKSFFTQAFAAKGIELKAGSVSKTVIRRIASVLNFWWKLLAIKSAPPITKHAAALISCHCTINNSKAKQQLGYRPVISVSEGMKQLTE